MSNFSSTYPAIRPTYQIDFSNGKRIPPNATFSRSDSPIDASKAAASAVHYWSNEKHLSSENLVDYSDDISQSSWTKNNMSETGGQTAPDGGTDAYKLTENSATSNHQIYKLIKTDGSAITFSGYFKYIGRQWVRIRLSDSSGVERHVWFDIQNGAVGTAQTGFSGATITASGNGYYKVSVTLSTSLVGGTQFIVIAGIDADNSTSWYAGSGADAFAVWGIQVSTTGETVLNETSGQIHREYAPTLKSVATAGQPRFEYDPASDGQSMGVLIEGQAQNLVTYSNDSTQWSSVNVNMTAASGVAPSGALEANLCVPSAATDYHWFYVNTPSFTSGTAYTQSVYVKAAGANYIQLSYSGSAFPIVHCNFDLTNGTVGSSSGMTGGIEAVGNGWYRISGTVTATSSATAIPFLSHITSSTDGRRPSTVGDGYSGYLVYGYQVEANSFASSYISSNSGSATTRAAESLSVATADIGYTGGPVALFAESSTQSPAENSNNRGVVDLSEPTTSNNRVMIYNRGAQAGGFFVNADNVQQGAGFGGITDDSYSKVAVSVDTNSVKHCVNGGTVSTDTSAVIPEGMTKLFIGQTRSGSGFGGHIKRVAIYPALTDTNLQALTS